MLKVKILRDLEGLIKKYIYINTYTVLRLPRHHCPPQSWEFYSAMQSNPNKKEIMFIKN